jgi:hypothetical protein
MVRFSETVSTYKSTHRYEPEAQQQDPSRQQMYIQNSTVTLFQNAVHMPGESKVWRNYLIPFFMIDNAHLPKSLSHVC